MKTRVSLNQRLFVLLCLLCLPLAVLVASVQGQVNIDPVLSDGENKALNAINSAPDASVKVAAAEAFVLKYPKSPARMKVAEMIAGVVGRVTDATQRVALAERLRKAFNAETEQTLMQSLVLETYVAARRSDEAFNLAATLLAKDPDDANILVKMMIMGAEEAKSNNVKHLPQTRQYGLKAIDLIEADKKPVSMDDAAWTNHKALLPQLYQQTAVLSLIGGDPADAKARLTKAITLNPNDPSSHAVLGYILNEEYVAMATNYKTMPEGKDKEEALKKVEARLDAIIDIYARAVGLATGKPDYEKLRNQVLPDLTSYYKYRHNQSTEGLQELIDKYKVKAGP